MGGYDVYGNVAALQALSDDQSAYHAKFQAIMQAIDSNAKTVLAKWEGAGQQEFLRAATSTTSAISRFRARSAS